MRAALPRCAAALLTRRLARTPARTGANAAARPRAMAASAPPPSPAAVVYVTAPSAAVATALSRALVTSRLAACVNVVAGVRSIYVWKGELCEDEEQLLVIKTRMELLGARQRSLRAGSNPRTDSTHAQRR